MDIAFNSNNQELAQYGILNIYVKSKIKNFYSKNIQKTINPKKQEIIINDWKKKNSIKSISELDNWLNIHNLNFDQWIQLINSDYCWASWCMNKYKDELLNYYNSKKVELDMFIYSIIKVSNKELADELYLRIKEKESTFEEIAYKFSEGIEKYTNGYIGPISIKNIDTSISSLLRVGDENQIWQPKLINKSWNILKLNKILHSKFNSQLKLKLALELGDKLLNEKFYEIQTKKIINFSPKK